MVLALLVFALVRRPQVQVIWIDEMVTLDGFHEANNRDEFRASSRIEFV
jgi:hypothetical protein